jgi:uncharacterized membrane protein YfcA
MNDIYFVLAGFLVGTIIGLTGVGGGSMMTPVLIFFMGIKPHLAVGTDLLFAAITKLGGTYGLWRQRLIPWPVVARLCAGSIPASLITLAVLNRVGSEGADVQWLITHTLGVALLLTAASLLYKALKTRHLTPVGMGASEVLQQLQVGHEVSPAPNEASHEFPVPAPEATGNDADSLSDRPWLTALFGFVIGCLVTLTSVGAGAIGVTVLMLLYPRIALSRIVAADIAYAVPMTLVAGLGHASMGSVDWPLLGKLVSGSLPGIWLGSMLITRTPERIIRLSLSVLLTLAGTKLVFN